MSLILDPATEERVQRELARGSYSEPADVITRALDLLEAEREDTETRRRKLIERIEVSIAQADRGEVYSAQEVRARMAANRSSHQHDQVA